MRQGESINHKYPGCQPESCCCSRWVFPTFHYAKCSFFKGGSQQTHPGNISACQPWKASIPNQQFIVKRFLKACDRVDSHSTQAHPPQFSPCNSRGSAGLKTNPPASLSQWALSCGNSTLTGLSSKNTNTKSFSNVRLGHFPVGWHLMCLILHTLQQETLHLCGVVSLKYFVAPTAPRFSVWCNREHVVRTEEEHGVFKEAGKKC